MLMGKCEPCNIKFEWCKSGNSSLLFRDAFCPTCGRKLQLTQARRRLPVSDDFPIDSTHKLVGERARRDERAFQDYRAKAQAALAVRQERKAEARAAQARRDQSRRDYYRGPPGSP